MVAAIPINFHTLYSSTNSRSVMYGDPKLQPELKEKKSPVLIIFYERERKRQDTEKPQEMCTAKTTGKTENSHDSFSREIAKINSHANSFYLFSLTQAKYILVSVLLLTLLPLLLFCLMLFDL